MNHYIDVIAQFGWTQAWQVSVVALMMLALVRLCCRSRPHLAYLFLLVALAKCLVPPVVTVPWSIFNHSELPQTTSIAQSDRNQVAWSGSSINSLPSTGTSALQAEAAAASATNPHAVGFSDRLSQAKTILAVLWVCGAFVVAVWILTTWLNQLGLIKRTSLPADARMVAKLQGIAGRIGLKRKVRLLVSSDSRLGPCCYGLIRPTIVVPEWLIAKESPRTVEQVLAHELMHIRRGDQFVAFLQVVAVVFWWFHPLVWLVSRGLSREREKCCDDEVIVKAGCEPASYVQALLNVLKKQRASGARFLVTGIRSVEVTKARLERIMATRNRICGGTPKSHWAAFVVMLLLVVPAGSAVSVGADRWERRSPFQNVQVKNDRVEVRVEGKQYVLLAIDELPTKDILKSSRKQFGNLWEKRFVEDLVEVMGGMGHMPGPTVTLKLSELDTGKVVTLREVPMTKDNRQAIYRARHRGGGANAKSAQADRIGNLVSSFVKASKEGDAGRVSRLLAKGNNTRNYIETTKKLLDADVNLTRFGYIEATPRQAIAATEFFRFEKGDEGQGMYCVVYRCSLRNGEWVISDIDLENLEGFAQELVRFVDKSREVATR